MHRALLAGLALALTSSAPALAAPRWIDVTPPFGDAPALQNEAGAAMAQDGRILFARITPDGAVEVRERPAGGPVGPTVTIPPVDEGAPQHLRVLMGNDGTAAVLFDADDERYAALRAPSGAWGDAEPIGLDEPGQEAIAADGVLWRVVAVAGRVEVLHRSVGNPLRGTVLPAPRTGAHDAAPALAVPRPGSAHVVYLEAGATAEDGHCQAKTEVLATDVPADGDAPRPAIIDSFQAHGTGTADQCDFDTGDEIASGPVLAADALAADTVAYSMFSFDTLTLTPAVRHRAPGAPWPIPAEPHEAVGAPGLFPDQIVGGRGLPLLLLHGPGGSESVSERRPDGTWTAPAPLAERPLAVQAARTGAGTTLTAWVERNTGQIVGRVVDLNGVPGDPVQLAPAAPGARMLGAGGDAEGNAVVLYSRPWDDAFALGAGGYDAAGPRVSSLVVPSDGAAGDPLDFTAAGLDVWSGPVTDVTWTFGDGQSATGATVRHAYADPGGRVVEALLRDAVGNHTVSFAVTEIGPPRPPATPSPEPTVEPTATAVPSPQPTVATVGPPAPDTRAPTLSIARAGRTVVVATDEPGRLAIALTGTAPGVRRGARCVAGGRHSPRCRRPLTPRTVTRSLPAGTRTVALPRLGAGTWNARAIVTDAAGNASRPRSLSFRVAR